MSMVKYKYKSTRHDKNVTSSPIFKCVGVREKKRGGCVALSAKWVRP
jgi:hypothetical protein